MYDDKSKNILDFYMQNNSKKQTIIASNKERTKSIAEQTVQSCINAIQMYDENPSFDLNKVIRMLLAKDFLYLDIDMLENKDKILELSHSFYRGGTKESLYARKALANTIIGKHKHNDLNEIYETLRNIERTGHKYWNVKTDRKESILEHTYGTILLVLGIESELNYCIDYDKAIKMLLVHDASEALIGDQTTWDITEEEKRKKELEANKQIFGKLSNGQEYIDLINEFNKRENYTSQYAYLCDKLDYDLQVKAYELQGLYDFENRPKNKVTESDKVKELISNGAKTVFDVHYEYDEPKYMSYPMIRRVLMLSKEI